MWQFMELADLIFVQVAEVHPMQAIQFLFLSCLIVKPNAPESINSPLSITVFTVSVNYIHWPFQPKTLVLFLHRKVTLQIEISYHQDTSAFAASKALSGKVKKSSKTSGLFPLGCQAFLALEGWSGESAKKLKSSWGQRFSVEIFSTGKWSTSSTP